MLAHDPSRLPIDSGMPSCGLALLPSPRRLGEAPGPLLHSALRVLASSTRSRKPALNGLRD
eukprot:6174071-Pleurochrysis_carterae.AAC.2